MKYDPYWEKSSTPYDTLQLPPIIEKTFLNQTEYEYPFSMLYEQECTIYILFKKFFSNEKWYERFNTKIHVLSSQTTEVAIIKTSIL